jgi:hypothetical protein
MTDKWDEVDYEVKTLGEDADRKTAGLIKHWDAKAETSRCSKLIHAHGGADWVWDQLGSGVLVMALCNQLGVSTSAFHRWVARGGEERTALYTRAREASAHYLAEQTISIADEADRETVQVAKLRSDNRWRMAAKLNPDVYGDKQQPMINIDLGNITLDALRKRDVDKPVHRLDDVEDE